MKTSHTSNSKFPKRKPILGLTPDDVIKQMAEEASGKAVRKVQRFNRKSEAPVLSPMQSGSAGGSGTGGIFGATPGDNAERAAAAKQPEVSDASSREALHTQLSRVLKRLLGETPPPALLAADGIERVATNAEALAAVVMRAALEGKQWAVEMVRDQTEGKPVRAAQINSGEQEVEDQLDRVSIAALNRLSQKGT